MTKLLATIPLLLGVLAACGDDGDDGAGDPAPVATVQVSTPFDSLDPGQTVLLEATPLDDAGDPLLGRAIVWRTSDEAIAAVSSDGLVTALGAGEVVISATSEGVTGEAGLVVRALPAEVATIEIAPAELVLTEGATGRLTAVVRDSAGEILDGRTVTWTSSDTAVAAVADDGLVTAFAAGGATITAGCEGVTAALALTVELAPIPVAWIDLDVGDLELSPGDAWEVSVIAHAEDGAPLPGRAVTWTSSAAAVASVDAAGRIEAHADGVARITASVEGREASITVTVIAVAEIVVSRPDAVIVVDEALQLGAEPRDATGQALARTITWASDHPEIATVDPDGLVVGVAEGGASITATAGGVTAEVLVFVSHWDEQPLLTVDGQALPATMVEHVVEGATVRFTAHQGTLRTRAIDGAYHLSVSGLTSRPGSPPMLFGYASEGYFDGNDAGTGYHFESSGVGVSFDGTLLPEGALSIVWQPNLASAPATLVFGAPAPRP